MDYIPVEITTLSTSPSTGGAFALVLSEVDGQRRLPIIIGSFEAQAIAFELEKIQPPRPLTHDLLRDAFEALGADVTEVVIDELREGTFYAKIRFTHEGQAGELDARPSDAIALAVRCEVPIVVAPSVFDEAGVPSEDDLMQDAPRPSEPERPAAPKAPARSAAREPVSAADKIEAQMNAAIEAEDYEKAARLRDELSRLRGDDN